MRTLLKKSEFAKRKHRSPACITKWIQLGKISSAAVVGEGQSARIWLERAEQDLIDTLHPSQQLGQEFPATTRTAFFPLSSSDGSPRVGQGADIVPLAPAMSERDLDMARRAKADADRAEHDAEAARRKLALDAGRYVDAQAASAQMATIASKTVTIIETAVLNRSAILAEKFKLPERDLRHILTDEFRNVRERAAGKLRDGAAQLPVQVPAGEIVENVP